MLKHSEFSQDVLNLKACRATKVESQFKVQEQRLKALEAITLRGSRH